MKKKIHPIICRSLVFASLLLSAINICTFSQARQVRDMDFSWSFRTGDQPGAEKPVYNDKDWRTLDVPHDWSIESPFIETVPFGNNIGYLPTGIGWYRKSFNLTKKDLEKTIWIVFDGVYMNSDVWINGHHLGHYPFGYNSFQYEFSKFAKAGINTLAVKVDNTLQPNSRWYAGSGIYRHVRLVLINPVHIAQNGVFITTPEISKEKAVVSVQTKLENSHSGKFDATVLSLILDKKGNEIARLESPAYSEDGKETNITQKLFITNPLLWSPETPELYRLLTRVIQKGNIIDNIETKFGVRSMEFLADKGFLLNGKQVKILGVGIHHDAGPVGVAVPEGVWLRRLNILKELGCNAIRTSHNPVAPEFLDMCDSVGFLVMVESFDEWTIKRVEYGYNKLFTDWSAHDLTQMIRRDRNHPSIFLWGVGNEIPDQGKPFGTDLLKPLMDICHKEDPTRPATVACVFEPEGDLEASDEFLETLDLVGYNYIDRWKPRREVLYTTDKIAHPERKILGTENSSIYSVRGEYSIGNNPDVFIPNYHTAMIDIEYLWKYILSHEFVMGDFMWTGIDYFGEAKWPNIGPPCGIIDRCGFPKDSYYFYKSIWTDEPMIHMFPHWNWKGREGQVLPVICYTNCEEVELFLNGKSYGVGIIEFPRLGKTMVTNWSTYETRKHATTSDLHLTWYLPYEPGVIKAVGKNDGKVVFTSELKTTGEPASIRLSVDKDKLCANSCDVAHIKVEIIDRDGNVVPTADNLVNFSIEGQANLIGVDNGNPKDHNSMKISQRNAFNGLCLAIIQSNGKPGKIKITARSKNLTEAIIELECLNGKQRL